MAQYGGSVPWYRVVIRRGRLPPGPRAVRAIASSSARVSRFAARASTWRITPGGRWSRLTRDNHALTWADSIRGHGSRPLAPPAYPSPPGAAAAGADRLRHRFPGYRLVRNGARAAAAAVPDRHPRGRRGARRPAGLAAEGLGRDRESASPGGLSDRTRTRWGARRPYLLFAGLAVAILFASMFAGVYTGGGGAVWVCVAFVATATAFAFFQVPVRGDAGRHDGGGRPRGHVR